MRLSRKQTEQRKEGVLFGKAKEVKYDAAFDAGRAKRTSEESLLGTGSIIKRYKHGLTVLRNNNYYSSSELSRKWHKAKEVKNTQATKIYEINLMQKNQ